jgi:transcriptional regulator with XRE-family HTH domain
MEIGKSLVGADKVKLDDERLRIECARRGWSTPQLAAAAGMVRSHVSAVRHGLKPVTRRTIRQLEQALQLEPDSLVVDAAENTTPKGKATP